MKKDIVMAQKEIKNFLLSKIPIKKYKIIKVYREKDFLGYYQSNSVFETTPIIKLNIPAIKQANKEYSNISIYEIILSTIIHELGHAIQELKYKPFDEEEAENFAFNFCQFGILNKI